MLDDLRHHVRRQLFVSHKVSDDSGHLALPEPIERQARHMRLPDPGWSELGPESDDEQRWGAADALDYPAQRLEARRIDPMCILEDHEHGLPACQSRELRCQGFQRPLSALLRHERECRIAAIVGKRQQFGKECGIHI